MCKQRPCEFQPIGVDNYSARPLQNAMGSVDPMSKEWFPGYWLAWGGTSEHTYALVEVDGYVLEVGSAYFRFTGD